MLIINVENLKDLQSATARLQRFLTEVNLKQEEIFDCKLVFSELVANVLKHSGGRATVKSHIEDGLVYLKISSEKPLSLPEKSCCSGVYAESGRGLFLVDSVCQTRILTEDGELVVTVKIQ